MNAHTRTTCLYVHIHIYILTYMDTRTQLWAYRVWRCTERMTKFRCTPVLTVVLWSCFVWKYTVLRTFGSVERIDRGSLIDGFKKLVISQSNIESVICLLWIQSWEFVGNLQTHSSAWQVAWHVTHKSVSTQQHSCKRIVHSIYL
jgi:hypothetical protein